MEAVIDAVLSSFAKHAPAEAGLVVKNHPLDTGWPRYGATVRRFAQEFGIADRVFFFETGDLSQMLRHCSGVVLVNSTTGMAALAAGKPVIALGRAIYDLPGLTCQGGLDAFWRAAEPPDAQLFSDFRRVVLHTTQVPGNFYSHRGQRMAIEAAMRFLEPEKGPLEALL